MPSSDRIQQAKDHTEDLEKVAQVASAIGTALTLGVLLLRLFKGDKK
jgi:hypothetical protein